MVLLQRQRTAFLVKQFNDLPAAVREVPPGRIPQRFQRVAVVRSGSQLFFAISCINHAPSAVSPWQPPYLPDFPGISPTSSRDRLRRAIAFFRAETHLSGEPRLLDAGF